MTGLAGLLVVGGLGGEFFPLPGNLQLVMPDATPLVKAVFVTDLRRATLSHLCYFFRFHLHSPFDLDFFILGLPPSLPFALAAAALRLLVTAPALAAREDGHTNATLWIGHLGVGTRASYPIIMGYVNRPSTTYRSAARAICTDRHRLAPPAAPG